MYKRFGIHWITSFDSLLGGEVLLITFLGDLHGRLDRFTVPQDKGPIVQLGDLGFGFGIDPWDTFEDIDWFIRGNHDKPSDAKAHPSYLGDYGYNAELDLFFVSGAKSIDEYRRKNHVEWWPDEELEGWELNRAINLYLEVRPQVIATHTCPVQIIPHIQKFVSRDKVPSQTEFAFESMLDLFQPETWVFGHWHPETVWQFKLPGCRTNFVCVPIEKCFTLE